MGLEQTFEAIMATSGVWKGHPGAAYRELEHRADLMLEISAPDLGALYHHALYALFDHLVEIGDVRGMEERVLESQGAATSDTLRGLLAEALYLFDTEGFVAAAAEVVEAREDLARLRLRGERIDQQRHHLLTEIKAITYHRLNAERTAEGGWKAVVLFDV